ncbi:MAG TPA: pitrilysin family protein [Bacteroidota bacterium]|nr:pitrilysin family protein [Bacteroidota bacterium]
MKTFRAAVLVLIFALVHSGVAFAQSQPAATGGKIQIPPFSKHVLDNGLTVVLMEYHRLPLVELQLTVRGGSSVDPDTLVGLASMTAGLLKKGTTARSATKIAEDIDFIGGTLNAGAGVDRFGVSSEFLKKDLDAGLTLFAEVVLSPTFPQEELDRERSQRLATIEQYKEEPSSVAGLYFARRVYGNHPYGNPAIGTAASLKKMTRDAVSRFYKETFLPNNAILVVVGDFHANEMLEKVKQVFGGWQKGTPRIASASAPTAMKGRKVVVVSKPDVTQTQIRIGNVGIDVRNPDWFAVQVANSILGNGFTSRLVEEIRVKRSLSYGARSAFPAYERGGMYLISTFTKNPTTRETIDVALEEVRKYREKGATKEELLKAQNYLAGDFARDLQAPENLASNLSEMIFYGFPNDHLETYVQRLKNVTLDDVKRVVQKYFLLDDVIIMVVTNPKETQDSLAGLGPIEVVPLEQAVQ